jgi:hypothetical protein
MIIVCAQAVKNESKREWRHSYILIAMGMKSLLVVLLKDDCVFLSSHHRYMCYHHWHLLHHIYASQINNNNVHQNPRTDFSDKDIHSSLGVVKEKVGDLPLNMCSTLQSNSCDNILKCIVCCHTLIPIRALKQMGT